MSEDRMYVQTHWQRQLATRNHFSNIMGIKGDVGIYFASGCLDAPDVYISQWNSDQQEFDFFDFREE